MASNYIYSTLDYIDYYFKSERYNRIEGEYEPFVYIIQEIETEMMYIGSKTQYSGEPCLESWLGTKYFTSSKYIIWEENEFEIVEIIPCASNHDALILEGLLIKDHNAVYSDKYYNRYHPDVGFNMSGFNHSEATKKKIGESRKGRPSWNKNISCSIETRKKISDSKRGASHSDEIKKRMSESKKGANHPMYGKTHSYEARKKMSETHKGMPSFCKGVPRSTETKKKISISMQNRTLSDEHKTNLSEATKRIPKKKCPYCDKEIAPNIYSRFHGTKCKNYSLSKVYLE